MSASETDPGAQPEHGGAPGGLDFDTLPQLFAAAVERDPRRTFLIWRPSPEERQVWSYGEAAAVVERVAGGLASLGVGVGDRVCICADNHPSYLWSMLALAHLGAVGVFLNAHSAAPEIADFLARSGAVGVLCDGPRTEAVDAARTAQWRCCWDGNTSGRRAVPWSALCSASPASGGAGAARSVAGIQFTSGSTSRPKGVVWTHANYCWGGQVSAAHEGLDGDDRHVMYLPVFHTNAQIYSLLATLHAGASLVLQPRFSARQFWPVACEERATWASMIPFAMKALRSQPVPVHSFRHWGTPVVVPSWERHFAVPLVGWWGMTETISHGIVSRRGALAPGLGIGYAAPEYDVRIVHDDGAACAPGEVGALQVGGVRGHSLFLEYLDDPAATAKAFTPDGYLITGDLVRADEAGWITFEGRSTDLLKVGGENVSPSEVEQVIRSLRGVDDVAVVGAPDAMRGEVPVAFVVAGNGHDPVHLEGAVLAGCREALAGFKVPAAVHVIDHLPEVALHKLARGELRKLAAQHQTAAPPTPPSRSEDHG